MKPIPQHRAKFIGVLLLAGVMGILLLVHVTSHQQHRCQKESFDINLIKLI